MGTRSSSSALSSSAGDWEHFLHMAIDVKIVASEVLVVCMEIRARVTMVILVSRDLVQERDLAVLVNLIA